MKWFGICSSVFHIHGIQNGMNGLKDASLKIHPDPQFHWYVFSKLWSKTARRSESSDPGLQCTIPNPIASNGFPSIIHCYHHHCGTTRPLAWSSTVAYFNTSFCDCPSTTQIKIAGLSRVDIVVLSFLHKYFLPCMYLEFWSVEWHTILVHSPFACFYALAHISPSAWNDLLFFNPLTANLLFKISVIAPLLKFVATFYMVPLPLTYNRATRFHPVLHFLWNFDFPGNRDCVVFGQPWSWTESCMPHMDLVNG